MRVWLSWSDNSSKLLANALNNWLPLALPNASLVMAFEMPSQSHSVQDWMKDVRDAGAGLVCVTQSTLDCNWVFFDFGVLRQCLGVDAIVAPVLLDVAPEEISATPLHVFQATRIYRNEMFALLRDINRKMREPLTDQQLETFFEKSWDDFDTSTRDIPGYELRVFVVTLKLPSRSVSFTFKPGEDRRWADRIERFVRSLPGSPLDVPPFDFGTLSS